MTAGLDGSEVHAVARSMPAITAIRAGLLTAAGSRFERGDGVRSDIFVVPAAGGEPRQLTHDRDDHERRGLAAGQSRSRVRLEPWITVPYLPTLRLWEARLDGDRLAQ